MINSRDFTYINNVIQENILGLTTKNKECYGEAFNIGCGGRYTLNELVKHINNGLNKNIIPIYGSNRPGDIQHSNANINKAISMLGYNPKVSFSKGIKTIKYYL